MKISSLNDIPSIRAYLTRIGAEPRSLRTAVVREMHGTYWRDIDVIKISPKGEVKCDDPANLPTESEQKTIEVELTGVDWPQLKPLRKLVDLPNEISKAPAENVFEFRDMEGRIIMLQVRIDTKGEKKYVPWTYWDDDMWRKSEPEGKLPLWGMDQLSNHSTAFIHEGAKAARAMRRMVEAETPEEKARLAEHPWGDELVGAAHLGWIGGALSPRRTDWSILKKAGIKRVYIVSDNDAPGLAAVPGISQEVKLPAFHIQFTEEWPAGFDLADPFPKKMFKMIDGKINYQGPAFREVIHPATWATDVVPNAKGKGKNTVVLREHFKDQWMYVEEVDMFICVEFPEILRPEAIMNKMLSKFSHVNNTSQLMVKAYRGRSVRLCYRPDITGRIVTDHGSSAINLHTPTRIKPLAGDPGPWLEFLKYMFPNESERIEVERWAATLAARPDVRMLYALLLVSKSTGIGKTTLANILARLVGMHNSGYPSESDITAGTFNGWLANKRLIIVSEIYSGHSWKAYNNLKGLITDDNIEVNQKYQRPYQIENWAHFIASSNSYRPLKMENDDRRWFYPKVTEHRWPKKRFEELNQWLASGGLGIILNWAKNYGNYVEDGARAPMTELKKELIASSRSKAQQEVADLAQAMVSSEHEWAFPMKEIEAWVKAQVQEKIYDTDLELRNTMEELGCKTWEKRLKVGGRLQYIVVSPGLFEKVRMMDESEVNEEIRRHVRKPNELLEETV